MRDAPTAGRGCPRADERRPPVHRYARCSSGGCMDAPTTSRETWRPFADVQGSATRGNPLRGGDLKGVPSCICRGHGSFPRGAKEREISARHVPHAEALRLRRRRRDRGLTRPPPVAMFGAHLGAAGSDHESSRSGEFLTRLEPQARRCEQTTKFGFGALSSRPEERHHLKVE